MSSSVEIDKLRVELIHQCSDFVPISVVRQLDYHTVLPVTQELPMADLPGLLSPRESFMLGLAVGEYESQEGTLFADSSLWLLRQFFPRFRTADGDLFGAMLDSVLRPYGVLHESKSEDDRVPDKEAAIRRLSEWASTSDCEDWYDLGRDFGRLQWVFGWFDFQLDEDGVVDELALQRCKDLCSRLSQNWAVKTYYFLDQALQSFRRLVEEALSSKEPEKVFICQSKLSHPAVNALYMGIGELLGVLRDLDDERKARDIDAVTPRSLWSIERTAAADVIRERIRIAEEQIAKDVTPGRLAEYVISATSPGIESLVRRLWGAGPIAGILHGKLDQNDPKNTDLDQRFAGVALSLYKQYRNPAEHEGEQFRCTLREAKYFLCGMHVLLDLYHQITRDFGRQSAE